jgi:hypothetical protein
MGRCAAARVPLWLRRGMHGVNRVLHVLLNCGAAVISAVTELRPLTILAHFSRSMTRARELRTGGRPAPDTPGSKGHGSRASGSRPSPAP